MFCTLKDLPHFEIIETPMVPSRSFFFLTFKSLMYLKFLLVNSVMCRSSLNFSRITGYPVILTPNVMPHFLLIWYLYYTKFSCIFGCIFGLSILFHWLQVNCVSILSWWQSPDFFMVIFLHYHQVLSGGDSQIGHRQ